MSLKSLVSKSLLEKKFKSNTQGLIFINFINFQNFELFELRIFFEKYNIFFIKLNTKSLNRLFLKSFKNNVVLSINNKNFYLNCSNLFLINFNNVYSYFFLIYMFLTKHKNKTQFLYFKINNNFLFFSRIFFLLNKYLNLNLLKEDFLIKDFKSLLVIFIPKLLTNLKIKYVNLFFVLKILIFIFFYRKMFKTILM